MKLTAIIVVGCIVGSLALAGHWQFLGRVSRDYLKVRIRRKSKL